MTRKYYSLHKKHKIIQCSCHANNFDENEKNVGLLKNIYSLELAVKEFDVNLPGELPRRSQLSSPTPRQGHEDGGCPVGESPDDDRIPAVASPIAFQFHRVRCKAPLSPHPLF